MEKQSTSTNNVTNTGKDKRGTTVENANLPSPKALPDRLTDSKTEGFGETQSLLSAIVDSSEDAILSKDLNGNILTWNQSAEQLFGYSAKEVIGKSITVLIPQDRLDEESNIVARLKKGERIAHVETLRRCKDGHLINVSITAAPVRNLQGEIIGVSKIIRDITERKQAEETQRESYARIRSHADELARFKEAAIERELRGIELKKEVNELSRRQGEGERYSPDFERQAKVVDEFEPAQVEYTGMHPEGVPLKSILCTEELSRRPSRPPDYEAENRALSMLVQSLADSPRTILQTLAETVRDIFKSDSAGLSLLTKDGRRFYWPAIAGMWKPHIGGGTPRDFGPCGDVLDCNGPLLFKRWDLRYPYLGAATPLAEEGLLIPFYVEGTAVGTIWAIAHNDQRKFDLEDLRQLESLGRFASAAYQAVEVKQAQESSRAALSIMEDAVLARKEMETLNKELRASEEALQIALRTRDEFISIASHELKTPLTCLKMQAQIRKRSLSKGDFSAFTPEKLIRTADDDVRQIDRLTHLVDDMLDISRLSSGKLSLQIEKVDLLEVVKGTVDRFGPQLEAVGSKVSLNASEKVLAQCDRFRMEQVFTNLLNNAIKYGSGNPINIEISNVKGMARVAIKDEGIGIAKNDQERVFGQFERAISANEVSGLGLGLFIVKQIVELHQGKILLESEPGKGSTFIIELPARQLDAQ